MKVLRYCVAVLIAGLIFGIQFAYPKEIAKVDDFVISDTDFKYRIMLFPERERVKTNKEKFLNKMIDEEILLREAQKLNLHEGEDYKRKVETFKREFLIDLYLRKYLEEKNTGENQRKYYEEIKEKFANPELVRISVISVKSEDEAKEILKKAQGGEDLAELARKYSKGPFAAKGGDFGFRPRKSIKKEFADAAFSMKKGEVSGPVKTEDGYHIIKLTDHKEAGIPRFDEVKNQIASDYAKKLLDEKISDLRKAVKIQIDSAELKNLKIE